MNRQPRNPFILAILLPVLSAVDTYAMEPASKVDTSAWMCNFCTYTHGWFGWLDIGPGYASDADLKFADYRGINDEGGFISAFGDIHYRNDDGRYLDIYARDLGTDARQVEARGGREGRYQVRLAYREIRKYRGYGTQTVHQGAGSNNLVLQQNWVTARTTAGMSALNASLNPVALDTTRKVVEAGLGFKITGKWRYDVDFQHTEKTGTRPFGAGVLTIQSSHFPAPVNFTTNRVDMGLDYAGKRSRLRFGFNSSAFNNDYTSITWENPFRPVGSTGVLRAALEPDNTFYQFNLTGSYRPTRKLRFSGRAAISRTKQDEAFLPYSSNPDFDDLTLPRTSLGGKIDTSTLNLATNLTDLELRPETPNRPYSFKRNQYSADLTWRARPFVSLRAGTKRKDYQRTLQSVRKTEEQTWWGEVNINHWAAAQLRLRLETSERDISPYLQVSDPGLQENILMRKFNLADRERERAVIELDLSPTERLSAGLSYFISEDSYEQSLLGLLSSDEESVSLDLGFVFNPNINLHAFVTVDEYESEIYGPTGIGLRPWTARTEDRFTTFGVSLKGKLSDKLNLAIDLVSADSKGRINTGTGAGEAPFPSLKTDLFNARISFGYQVNRQWGWTFYAEHEDYDSADWQIDGLGNDGISAILTLGEVSPDYSVTIVRLLANYKFD